MSRRLLAAFLALAAASAAQASVVISTAPTSNMSCSAGSCTATAADAVLNVDDLEGFLAAGNVTVTSGNVSQDIELDSPLSWPGTQKLTLSAAGSIRFNAVLTVAGAGALTLTPDSDASGDGTLRFAKKGHVAFSDTSSKLTIGGDKYKLVGSLRKLAKAATGSAVRVALARDIGEARKLYQMAPVANLDGIFEGLGNTISHFQINGSDGQVALIGQTSAAASVRDLNLVSADITHFGNSGNAAILIGNNFGTVQNVRATGAVHVTSSDGVVEAGGLVGTSFNAITSSQAAVDVTSSSKGSSGGLVGVLFAGCCFASLQTSFSTGAVSVSGNAAAAGGIVGFTQGGFVLDCYARGSVTGSAGNNVFGGLAGINTQGGSFEILGTSYSTAAISAPAGGIDGGAIGEDTSVNTRSVYWDLDTSGISDPSQGAGSPSNDRGVTGLHSAKLKAQLPSGFDPAIWGQDAHINSGYPYLLDNPPR
ncbi:MAG: hypothetical protein JOZ72_10325 [Alphaproteobacteria bacterium]|nr:hypothetical protein [Alphaproteobacteria bacterium]